MADSQDWVYVVDDDLSVREALSSLIRSVGLQVETYASAAAFLEGPRPPRVACLILDVRMPGLTGLELQARLAESGASIPIIFITGHGDIPMAVRAIKKGAVEFLAKPFRDEDLLAAIRSALAQARSTRQAESEVGEIRRRYALLTGREKEVITFMVRGALNKQAAAELGVSEMTVKVHRHNIMHKMGVTTLPDLVRMVERLQTGNEGSNGGLAAIRCQPGGSMRAGVWQAGRRVGMIFLIKFIRCPDEARSQIQHLPFPAAPPGPGARLRAHGA